MRPTSAPIEKKPCPPVCPRIQTESLGICAITWKRSQPFTASPNVMTRFVAGPECDHGAALSANPVAVLSRHAFAKQSVTACTLLFVDRAK